MSESEMHLNRLSILRCAALFFAALCPLSGTSAMEPGPARQLVLGDRPLVVAHRGNSSEAPENTLPAFASAVKLGVDFVELDYHHTADGVPVVFHDKTLERTTNAVKLWGGEKPPLVKYRYAQLQELDAGAWFDPQFAGTKLATLGEALDVIQAGSLTMVEHKSGDARTLVKLLQEKKLTDKVIVQSFDWKFIADVHALDESILLGALGDKELTAARLDEVKSTGAHVVGWNHKHITTAEIDLIHARGYKAWVYTVDDAERAKELFAGGIDAIISNRPAAILKVRAAVKK